TCWCPPSRPPRRGTPPPCSSWRARTRGGAHGWRPWRRSAASRTACASRATSPMARTASTSPRRTSSCCPASGRPSASCCWRPWRAACPAATRPRWPAPWASCCARHGSEKGWAPRGASARCRSSRGTPWRTARWRCTARSLQADVGHLVVALHELPRKLDVAAALADGLALLLLRELHVGDDVAVAVFPLDALHGESVEDVLEELLAVGRVAVEHDLLAQRLAQALDVLRALAHRAADLALHDDEDHAVLLLLEVLQLGAGHTLEHGEDAERLGVQLDLDHVSAAPVLAAAERSRCGPRVRSASAFAPSGALGELEDVAVARVHDGEDGDAVGAPARGAQLGVLAAVAVDGHLVG